jgi:hypothetical protein
MTSTIKVNNIQNQCGQNIINENSNTITIGASGDTIALASGASQTGFGRTGTVDWQTGSIKTSTFTAANGEGYFCNTTSGGFTVNLPAGSAGAIVSVQDYDNTFDSNSLTVTPNGSEKINGGVGPIILNTEGEGLTLVYIDATVGWRSIQDSSFADVGSNFISATGGTITTSGNDKIHTFTGPGTFTVSCTAVCAANNLVSYMVIAGGGGGGGSNSHGGGGGAGGYRETKSPATPYTASPLDGYSTPGNRITVTATAFPITVGAGAAGAECTPNPIAASGSNSIFSTITSAGGAGGGGTGSLAAGGSGGGSYTGTAGVGNTPPTTPPQGNNGGSGNYNPSHYGAGGGGGAGAVGTAGSTGGGGPGGAGVATCITGSPVTRAGGGGGSSYEGGTQGTGGPGGGGNGTIGGPAPNSTNGSAGTANTGGGGGGGERSVPDPGGKPGGSGIVVIRYKFQ